MIENTSYEYLFKIFSKEELEDRFSLIKEMAVKFLKRYDLTNNIFCSNNIIYEVIVDYYSDIARLKDFHNIEKSNITKVASYLCYWISKRKPLQLISDDTPPGGIKIFQLLNVNAYFSYQVFLSLQFDIEQYLASNNMTPWHDFQDLFIYNLVYRNYNPQNLELIALGLKTDSLFPPLT